LRVVAKEKEMGGATHLAFDNLGSTKEISMECTRCHGVMAKERLYDLLENDGQVYVSGWRWAYRCVACGKVSDWVIERNRQIADKAVTTDQRKRNARNAEAGAA